MTETPLLAPPSERSLRDRWFSPMKPGSLRMTTLFLVTSATGAGFVSMPAALKTSGLVGSIFLMIFAIFALHESIVMTGKCYSVLGFTRYGQIANYLGGKRLEVFGHWIVILSTIFSIMVHNVVLVDILATVFYQIGLLKEMPDLEKVSDLFRIVSLTVVSFLQMFMIANARSPGEMKRYAFISLSCLGGIIILLLSELPAYLETYWPNGELNWGIGITSRTPRDLSLFMFSFSVSGNAIIATQNLYNATPRRLKKVSVLTNGYLAVIYATITILAYLSTLDQTPTIFLNRPPTPGLPEWPMQLARCGVMLCLNSSNIGLFASLRAGITQMRYHKSESFDIDSIKGDLLIQDLITVISMTLLSLCFPQILTTLSLIGGSGGVILSTIPIFAGMKAEKLNWLRWKAAKYWFLVGISASLGFYTTIFDLMVYLGYLNE
mmetsp:Transcript_27489/g.31692  ORF Transcript_27489/g.31692 Transcript_27489/m.31692 type:complete len:436 (+) Transcript_27489:308-1615(+)